MKVSEGEVSRVAEGEGKVQCLSARFPFAFSGFLRRSWGGGGGTECIHGDERRQTPAINIVLLKNRTLVSVFERKGGGRR